MPRAHIVRLVVTVVAREPLLVVGDVQTAVRSALHAPKHTVTDGAGQQARARGGQPELLVREKGLVDRVLRSNESTTESDIAHSRGEESAEDYCML